MCRNIRPLFNFEPAATEEELRDAALQYVRKISGMRAPSRANEATFDRAVDEVAAATRSLVQGLQTTSPPRDREHERAKAQDRWRNRAERTLGEGRRWVLSILSPQMGRTLGLAGLLLGLLFAFFVGLDLMGLSFKLFGKGFAETLIETTSDPFVGLFVGILATTLVQSSSTTTSMTVALVAAGALTIEGAIPIIMGANIGTSVTNTLVSLAHVTRREEFERAFAGATIHDFFNWIAVLILLPLELATGYLAKSASFVESLLEGVGGIKLMDPLKAVVRPVAKTVVSWLGESGVLVLIVGIVILIISLKFLVDLLRVAMTGRAEKALHSTLFRSAWSATFAGLAITVMVQSSSITTSLMIPLVAAGVVTLEQLFPFTIGANVGTTITAMLAALSTGSPAAVTVAFSHLIFNISAAVLIYVPPFMRGIPLALARGLGRLGSRNRALAATYILLMFFGLPLLILFVTGAL